MRLGGGEIGVWAALGERVVVVGGAEVGEWVVPPQNHRRRESSESSPSSKVEMTQVVLSQLPSLESSRSASPSHQSLHQALSSPTPLSDRGRVGVVLRSLEALDVLAPLACSLLRTGHRLDIRIPSLLGGEREEVIRGGCWLRYRGGRVAEGKDERRTEISGVDVVIVGGEGLGRELGELDLEGGVRIVVPERDLVPGGGGEEIWDWVGTLGIASLKSGLPSLLYLLRSHSLTPLTIFLQIDWHTPNIQLALITSSRPLSLPRLLTSLQQAHYLAPNPTITLSISLERNASPKTLALVRDFDWSRNGGQVNVRHRVKQGGVLLAVTESWYPKDEHAYGVMLEGDVEL